VRVKFYRIFERSAVWKYEIGLRLLVKKMMRAGTTGQFD